MIQGAIFDYSGPRAPAYASPYYSCVWAISGHHSHGAQRPNFTLPSPLQALRKAYYSLALPPSANSTNGPGRFNPHNWRAAA